ncbi:SDR family oxidoreductase [Alteromonas pelagimontana]|uniref:SDR family oxidoreductase n=1 Tax=Alteromonas pelagimontana TaxID=1858656 RepID=A0A6M4MH98_9ALTE|nr:SDR family oxidoreductase [Alteromonas pelagimontana]QJR81945.1 SDR family oxidoreductase [Alteromonas pelagimontana]
MRKNILITGASSGLGRGMALEFARAGHNLALCARRMEQLEAVKLACERLNPAIQVAIVTLDVDDHQEVFTVFEHFADRFGTLDRIIVNAGVGKGAAIGTGHFQANKQTATTNFVSALAQCEAAMTIFRRQNAGHLVTISSVSAVRGFRRAMTVYAATKAGLGALTEGIRVDVLDTPIQVSTIYPGFIRTEINEKVKRVPFIVDTETGCRALVKAINKEKANCYVPVWPWAFLQYVLRIAPLRWLAKMS